MEARTHVDLDCSGVKHFVGQAGEQVFEDHLSALCESMRLLIAGDVERRSAPVDVQRNFFQKQLYPWVFDCCAAIEQSSIANYYRRVAEFGTLFMAVERDSLDMD